jgi:Trk K+ transport system NAD-binding subunit
MSLRSGIGMGDLLFDAPRKGYLRFGRAATAGDRGFTPAPPRTRRSTLESDAMQPVRRPFQWLLGALALLLAASAILYVAGVRSSAIVVLDVVLAAALLLVATPLYLLPEIESRVQRRLPDRMPRLRDGVLLFRDGPAIATLCGELARARVDAAIVETDEATVRRMVVAGRPVVFAGAGPSPLGRLELDGVRAIVAAGRDDESAAMTLAARQAGFEGEILALARESRHRKALSLAGATRVLAPRQVLAATLAARASERVVPRIAGSQSVGRKLVVSEVKLGEWCPHLGKTLKGDDVGRRTGVQVIGQWRHGELQVPIDPEAVLDPELILIVAGAHENVARFRESCADSRPQLGRPFVVAGCGEVGRAAAQILAGAGEQVVTVDARRANGVDVEGELGDPAVLEAAGVRFAQAVLLTLGGDSASLLATLSIRDHAAGVPILARVEHAENVERIRRAGADFAVSLSQVAAQLVTARLLGSDAILIHPALRVQKVPTGSSLVGRHPAEIGIRERTGASVVAIERGEDVIVSLDPSFTFLEDDAVYVCGSDQAIDAFVRTFPVRYTPPAPRPVAASASASS